jgi:Ring finger domain
MHSPCRSTSTLNSSPQSVRTELEETTALNWEEFFARNCTMANPSNNNNNPNPNSRRKPEVFYDDLDSLKPRPRPKLYPTIPDFDIATDEMQAPLWADLAKDTEKTASQRDDLRRSSITSEQTIPSDCSAEDLQAIQAALYEDQAEEDEASMALVQQLLREEYAQSQSDSDMTAAASVAAPQEASHNEEKIDVGIANDLIYQLCLHLDEVNIDVKSENWQMLAPHVIDQLPLLCYDCNTTTTTTTNSSSCCGQDTQCLVCLTDYEQGEHFRNLPKCGHSFHQACIDPWLLKHDWCPVCRTTIDD